MARLVGINHIAVEVGDVDEAIAFFGQIFDDVTLRGAAGNMAFVDLGDQFIALESVRGPVSGGHFGLVVDDRDEAVRRLARQGAEILGSHDVLDPWGNRWQVVDYRDIQFTKTPRVSRAWASTGSTSPIARSASYARRTSRTDVAAPVAPSLSAALPAPSTRMRSALRGRVAESVQKRGVKGSA